MTTADLPGLLFLGAPLWTALLLALGDIASRAWRAARRPQPTVGGTNDPIDPEPTMTHHQTQTYALAGIATLTIGASMYAHVVHQPVLTAACVLAALGLSHAARREHCRGVEVLQAARMVRRSDIEGRASQPEGPDWCCVTGHVTEDREHAAECRRGLKQSSP
ncbi:hypothetical protein ACFQ6V_23640 [Streptomyces roseifaciens]